MVTFNHPLLVRAGSVYSGSNNLLDLKTLGAEIYAFLLCRPQGRRSVQNSGGSRGPPPENYRNSTLQYMSFSAFLEQEV